MSAASHDYKQGMRHLPAGVCLITTGRAPQRAGLTATAVMSLTADPPQLVAAVNRGGAALPAIAAHRAFAINVLASTDIALAETFAGRTSLSGEARFAGADWTELQTGSPLLTRAIVSFDCVLAREIPVATHALLIGAVQDIRFGLSADPLLHCNGEWANLTSAVRYNGFVDELEIVNLEGARRD